MFQFSISSMLEPLSFNFLYSVRKTFSSAPRNRIIIQKYSQINAKIRVDTVPYIEEKLLEWFVYKEYTKENKSHPIDAVIAPGSSFMNFVFLLGIKVYIARKIIMRIPGNSRDLLLKTDLNKAAIFGTNMSNTIIRCLPKTNMSSVHTIINSKTMV